MGVGKKFGLVLEIIHLKVDIGAFFRYGITPQKRKEKVQIRTFWDEIDFKLLAVKNRERNFEEYSLITVLNNISFMKLS